MPARTTLAIMDMPLTERLLRYVRLDKVVERGSSRWALEVRRRVLDSEVPLCPESDAVL